MTKFIVSTDSTADLYADYAAENDVRIAPLTFTIEKEGVVTEYLDNFTEYAQYRDFYAQLRDKALPRTAMLNYEAHMRHFRAIAESGAENVLHFTISSGLADTVYVARQAAADIRKEYPKFNCIPFDSLAATIGQGELVYEAVRLRDAGYTLEEAYEKIKDLPMHFQYLISADDLNFLQRGGRVGKVSAVFGTALQIKPVMTFTADGKLEVTAKVRRTRGVIQAAMEKMDKFPPSEEGRMIHIVHTDAEEDALLLSQEIESKYGFRPEISIMGPVIGTHVGPGGVSVIWKSDSLRTE